MCSQLEDDIVAKPGYSQAMKTYVRSLASDDWMLLEFSQLGFIGESVLVCVCLEKEVVVDRF